MPIFVSYVNKRRSVRIITAGGERLLLCPELVVTLQAEVNDLTSTVNHTFEWVQLTGNPVILTRVDETISTFIFSGDTSDKTFRYYIDRGTTREQYKDLEIYYTPTDKFSKQVYHKNNMKAEQFFLPDVELSDTLYTPNTESYSEASCDYPQAVKYLFSSMSQFWSDSGAEIVLFEVLGSLVYSNNPTGIFLSFNKYNLPTSIVLPKGSYKFRVTIKKGSIQKTILSNLFVSRPTPKSNKMFIGAVDKSSRLNYYSSPKNITRRSNKVFSAQSIYTISNYKYLPGKVSNEVRRTGKSFSVEEEQYSLSNYKYFSSYAYNINRLDTISIGG